MECSGILKSVSCGIEPSLWQAVFTYACYDLWCLSQIYLWKHLILDPVFHVTAEQALVPAHLVPGWHFSHHFSVEQNRTDERSLQHKRGPFSGGLSFCLFFSRPSSIKGYPWKTELLSPLNTLFIEFQNLLLWQALAQWNLQSFIERHTL